MKKTLLTVAMSLAAFSTQAQLAYPGSNWSTLMFPAGVASTEQNNVVLQGKIEQGIDWVRFGSDKKWVLNTYVSMGYAVDKDGLDYNNKVVPAVGVKLSRRFDTGVIDLGFQHTRERRWVSGDTGTGTQAYVSYWFGWDLKK